MEKVVLTTGGTGGHIFPALAVAEELRSRYEAIKILFIGSFYGPEAKLAMKHGIPFEGLQVRGFLGRGFKAIPAAFNMLKATAQAYKFLKSFRPDAVAGFGGYASFAPMLAARMLGIPSLIHEQNAIAGTGNRFLSKFANKVCVSLPETKGFKKFQILTGNPVRKSIVSKTGARKYDAAHPHLLVLGGSQGAHALNDFMVKILSDLKKHGVEIRHQSGVHDLEKTRNEYEKNGYSANCVSAFFDDMANLYEWADLVICRSGATTIAELCVSGLPAILVPFPSAIHDHQTLNARLLEKNKAALLVNEKSLEPSQLVQSILNIFENEEKLKLMSQNALALGKKEAASALVDNLEDLCGEMRP